MLHQTVLMGKAQKIHTTMPPEGCADFEIVKVAVLKSFDLVPEAYRQQKFRQQKKRENLSYVEFVRNKESMLKKWCDAKKIEGNFEKL